MIIRATSLVYLLTILFIISRLVLLLLNQSLEHKTIFTENPVWDVLPKFAHRILIVNVGELVRLSIVVADNFEFRFHIAESVDEHDRVHQSSR